MAIKEDEDSEQSGDEEVHFSEIKAHIVANNAQEQQYIEVDELQNHGMFFWNIFSRFNKLDAQALVQQIYKSSKQQDTAQLW